MKTKLHGAIALQAGICLLVANAAFAQEQKAERYLYVTYHVCDLSQQERADEIFAQVQKPAYEAAVADGTISSYGWIAHHTGGKWRRATYYGAGSVQALLDAQDKIGDRIDANPKNEKLSSEFSKICNSHDDYIWRTVATCATRVVKARPTRSSRKCSVRRTTRWWRTARSSPGAGTSTSSAAVTGGSLRSVPLT
jgi:hypothetical protein